MSRTMIYSLIAIIILIVTIIGGIAWLVTTEAGLRALVDVAKKVSFGELQIKTVNGRLLDKFSFTELSYQHEKTMLKVDSFQWEWEIAALWQQQRIHINKLHIRGVTALLPKSAKKDSKPLQLPDIRLPIQIALDDLHIQQVEFKPGEDEPIIIDNIDLRSTTAESLSLEHFNINSPLLTAKLVGKIGLVSPHHIQLDLNWIAKLPEFTVIGKGELTGDSQSLVLTHHVSEPLAVDLKTTVTDFLGNLTVNAELTWQEIFWPFHPQIAKNYLIHSQHGAMTVKGSLEDYTIDFKSKISGQQIPIGTWQVTAQGNRHELTVKQLQGEVLAGIVQAVGKINWQTTLAGELNFETQQISLQPFWQPWPQDLKLTSQIVAQVKDNHLTLNKLQIELPKLNSVFTAIGEGNITPGAWHIDQATFNWQQLQWPLDKPQINSERGHLQLTGSLQDYQVNLETQLAGSHLPPGQWHLTGKGNEQQFQLEALHTDSLQGKVTATGQISWQPSLDADINLQAQQVTLQHLWPEWPNQLKLNSQLAAQIQGEKFDIAQLQLAIPQTGTQLSLQASGLWREQNATFKQAQLQWRNLQWPLIGTPPMLGSKTGLINLTGTLQNYHIDLTTDLFGEKLPPGKWNMQGRGNLQQLTLNSLQGDLLQGQINGFGEIAWQPRLLAQITLGTEQITLTDFWQDWPKSWRLNSQLQAQLNEKNFQIKSLTAKIPQSALQLAMHGEGTLAGERTHLRKAQLTWKGLQWPLAAKVAQVASKQGSLNLSGTLQNYQVNMQTQVIGAKIPAGNWQLRGQGNLQQFTLQSLIGNVLEGKLQGQGQITWNPTLAAQVDVNIEKIALQDFWQEWPKSWRLNSQLLADIHENDIHIKTLTANIPQTAAQLSLQGEGTLAGEQTKFKQVSLKWQELPWPLNEKVALITSKQGLLNFFGTLQDYQVNLQTQVIGAKIPAGTWQLRGQGNLQQFTLQSLTGKILEGKVQGTGQINWQPTLLAQVDVNIEKLALQNLWQDWPQTWRLNSQLLADIRGNDFHINTFTADIPQTTTQISLQGTGTLAGEQTKFNQISLQWKGLQWPAKENTILMTSKQGFVNLLGTLQNYQIEAATELAGNKIPAGTWQLRGQGNLQQFTLQSLTSQFSEGKFQSKGQITWKPTLAAQLDVNIEKLALQNFWQDWPQAWRLNSQLIADIRENDFNIQTFSDIPQAAAQISLQGAGTLAGEQTKFDKISLNWKELQWPFGEKTTLITSKQGSINLVGTLQNYQVEASTALVGNKIPAGTWQLRGQGNLQQFTIHSLASQLLKGKFQGKGQINWQPTLAAQVDVKVENIALQDFWQEWPQALRLNSQLIANLEGNNFKIKTLTANIPNTAMQLALQGEGTLAGEQSKFKQISLNWKELQWPLKEKPILMTSKQGLVNLTGTLQNYQLDGKTHLAGTKIPAGTWQVRGQGNLQQFTLNSLTSQILEGKIQGKGQITWKPALAAQVDVNIEKVALQEFWQEWPQTLRLNSQLSANLVGNDFKIKTLTANIPKTAMQLAFQGEGTLAGEQTFLKKSKLTWQELQWPLAGKVVQVTSKQGLVNVFGTLQNYQVDAKTQLLGEKIPAGNWQLRGQGNLQQFAITSLAADSLEGKITGNGLVSWQPSLAVQLNLNADQITIKDFWQEWPTNLKMNSQISAQLRENKFQINQLKVDVPAAPLQLLLRGQGNLAGKNSQFATEISWQSLRWPLISTSYATKSASMAKPTDFLVYSQQGNLVASGNLDNYQLELRTKLEGKDIPQGDWHAVGKGDARHLQLESLQADVLEGALKLSGDVSWQPIVSWQVAINGTNLNPESQWKQWPGKLAVDLRNEGQLDNGGELQTLLEIKQLSGELRHYPLRLQTQLSMRLPRATTSKVKGFSLPVELAIKALELQSGNAQFTAYGNVGQQMNLTWNLDAPNIAAFFPESQGSIAGKGEVKGTLPLPSVMAELRGQKLRLQNSKLDSLRANVAFAADRDSQLMVFVDNFQQDNQHIKKISCTGNGKLTAHTLTTDIVFAEQNRLNLQLQGSFKQPRWQGELQQFNVSLHPLIQGNAEEKTRLPESVIHWQLQAPTALILSPTEVQLMPLCIHQNQTVQLCAQFKWQPQAKSILKVQLIELPLLTLTRLWLSPEQSLTGNINGMFEATLNPNGTLRSQGNINLSPGTVTWLEESFAHHGGNFALQINEKGLNSQVNFKLLEQSSIQGQLQLPQFTRLPPAPEQPLQGSIKLAFADLKILPTLMPQADNTEGRMSMDVFLSGTVTQPQIQGQLQLQNVAMDLIDLGIRINELNLVAKTVAQNNLTMQASMKSGEKGQLSATGEAQLVSLTDWQARLQLTGEAFEVVNTPDAWALASPDLSIKLLPSHIDVTGKVLVPEALITPTKVGSGAVTVSKDVVIVTSEEPNGPSAGESGEGKMAISSRVQIILGNKVTFKAAGFQSHFAGNVIASGQPRKVTMGNGELRITEGRYKAYGQDLKIDEGRVMFSGGPIENPGLDIKAYRQIKRQGDDEVIAGVHIQGTAQSPRLILYSSPSFDESNILSYLVLGKPAAQATQSEGNALLKAAASLSFDKSSALTRKIGKTFGLDEAGISTDKGLDEAEFVVGKYLTPELYISYGIGLFDTNQVVRMRYELTKRLTVETETGDKGQGVDLFYHFEH